MSMFDMMFNADEKQKMMDGFALVLSKAVAEGIDAKIEVIEQAVERVLLKHGVIGSLDDVIRQTVSELQPSGIWTTCSCGHIAQEHDKQGVCELVKDKCPCKHYDGHVIQSSI